MEICPICGKKKGYIEGSWICFTPWWECGINSMTDKEEEIFSIVRSSVDHEIYDELLKIWRGYKFGN